MTCTPPSPHPCDPDPQKPSVMKGEHRVWICLLQKPGEGEKGSQGSRGAGPTGPRVVAGGVNVPVNAQTVFLAFGTDARLQSLSSRAAAQKRPNVGEEMGVALFQ